MSLHQVTYSAANQWIEYKPNQVLQKLAVFDYSTQLNVKPEKC